MIGNSRRRRRAVRVWFGGSTCDQCTRVLQHVQINVATFTPRRPAVLEQSNTELMMHDIAVLYQDHCALQVWIDQSGPKEERGLAVGKGPVPASRFCISKIVGVRAVLEVLLPVAAERA